MPRPPLPSLWDYTWLYASAAALAYALMYWGSRWLSSEAWAWKVLGVLLLALGVLPTLWALIYALRPVSAEAEDER